MRRRSKPGRRVDVEHAGRRGRSRLENPWWLPGRDEHERARRRRDLATRRRGTSARPRARRSTSSSSACTCGSGPGAPGRMVMIETFSRGECSDSPRNSTLPNGTPPPGGITTTSAIGHRDRERRRGTGSPGEATAKPPVRSASARAVIGSKAIRSLPGGAKTCATGKPASKASSIRRPPPSSANGAAGRARRSRRRKRQLAERAGVRLGRLGLARRHAAARRARACRVTGSSTCQSRAHAREHEVGVEAEARSGPARRARSTVVRDPQRAAVDRDLDPHRVRERERLRGAVELGDAVADDASTPAAWSRGWAGRWRGRRAPAAVSPARDRPSARAPRTTTPRAGWPRDAAAGSHRLARLRVRRQPVPRPSSSSPRWRSDQQTIPASGAKTASSWSFTSFSVPRSRRPTPGRTRTTARSRSSCA